MIQGYVEIRQIPVLSEDRPKVLQPGWSKQYREEREKIVQECVDETNRRHITGSAGTELEMKDMASIDQDGAASEMIVHHVTLM